LNQIFLNFIFMKKYNCIILVLLTCFFWQCRKCVECTGIQEISGTVIETPFEKFCGLSKDVISYENALKENVPENVEIICTSN